MKTIHQFTMNRQFFKIILDLVHTRDQISNLVHANGVWGYEEG